MRENFELNCFLQPIPPHVKAEVQTQNFTVKPLSEWTSNIVTNLPWKNCKEDFAVLFFSSQIAVEGFSKKHKNHATLFSRHGGKNAE